MELGELGLRIPAGLADGSLVYAADPGRMRPGHRLQPLIDGAETYPAMLESIRRAREYVHFETYIFEDDRTGRRFANALMERARAGVSVRLLYDAFGSLTFALDNSLRAEIVESGVEVLEFHPSARGRRWGRWLRRDHRKILVVDGERAFVGGINIGDEYAPKSSGGGGWRDTHLRIEGPIVADLDRMFSETWNDAGGAPFSPYPREADESLASPHSELAVAVGSDAGGRRTAIRRHLLHAIRRARRHVFIASAYFIPDRMTRRALIAAVRRGVAVHIIVPGESDLRSVQLAGEHTYAELLEGGVRLHQWRGAHMHAKAVVVDGIWTAVGSYNLDYISLFHNLEVVVEVIGRRTGEAMTKIFRHDFAVSHEVSLAKWSARPRWHRWLEWVLYRFRRWL